MYRDFTGLNSKANEKKIIYTVNVTTFILQL